MANKNTVIQYLVADQKALYNNTFIEYFGERKK